MLSRLAYVALAVAVLGAGCAGLNVQQQQGWQTFHDCQRIVSAPAALEDLLQSGRVNYRTQEGVEFSAMKTCMEARGYTCDLGLAIGSRPHTYCYPKTT